MMMKKTSEFYLPDDDGEIEGYDEKDCLTIRTQCIFFPEYLSEKIPGLSDKPVNVILNDKDSFKRQLKELIRTYGTSFDVDDLLVEYIDASLETFCHQIDKWVAKNDS